MALHPRASAIPSVLCSVPCCSVRFWKLLCSCTCAATHRAGVLYIHSVVLDTSNVLDLMWGGGGPAFIIAVFCPSRVVSDTHTSLTLQRTHPLPYDMKGSETRCTCTECVYTVHQACSITGKDLAGTIAQLLFSGVHPHKPMLGESAEDRQRQRGCAPEHEPCYGRHPSQAALVTESDKRRHM